MRLPVVEAKTDQAPWYSKGLHFSCQQCGNCCTGGPGYVWISEEEISRLAAHLKISESETRETYCRKIGGQISLKERKNSVHGGYDCIFLREGKSGMRTCSIYPVRPLQCRTWPFWPGNLQSRKAWERAGIHCRGIDQGKLVDRATIETIRDSTDWPDAEE